MRNQSPQAIALRARARSMRKQLTPSEYVLWQLIRRQALYGIQFRRQQVLLGRYIADFVAPKLKFVVEVDGGYHALTAGADAYRQRALERAGYAVLRLSSELVLKQPLVAVAQVCAVIERLQFG